MEEKFHYNSTPLPNHTITWKFRFWKYETVDNAAQSKYGVHFDELSASQQEEIFNTTPADYEGTHSDTYGSITSTSTTDSSGIATSIYTAGVEAGFIEFWYEDRSIKKAKRGSFLFEYAFGMDRFGEEKLKLRIYVEDPPAPFWIEKVKENLRNCFNFIGDERWEWTNQKFNRCNKNEFNILPHTLVSNPGEMGFHGGNAKCWVYYENMSLKYSTRLNERAGRVAAHEMGHSYTAWHHNNCVMVANIPDLPERCEHFCDWCKAQWNTILGGGVWP